MTARCVCGGLPTTARSFRIVGGGRFHYASSIVAGGAMPREFPTSLAAEVTVVALRTVNPVARTGMLPPPARQASEKVARRSYTFQDLVSIRTIVDFRARQCPLQQIRAAFAELRKLNPDSSNS